MTSFFGFLLTHHRNGLTFVLRSMNQELNAISEEYKTIYKSELADDVHADTSGDFQELLMKLLKTERDQGSAVNKALARQDAEKLAVRS